MNKTVYKAKGFEFKNLIITNCYQNNFLIFLAVNSGDQNAMDEEARIFYVAMSRSQKLLIFTAPSKNKNRGTYVDCNFIQEDLVINYYIQLIAEHLAYKEFKQKQNM